MRWWPFRSAVDRTDLTRKLLAFVNAESWDESRLVLKQHPELLRQDAYDLLDEMWFFLGDAETVRVLRKHQHVLLRCREVGIDPGLDEMLSNPHGLVGIDLPGMGSPWIKQVMPEFRALALVLGDEGLKICTHKDLKRAFARVPEMRAKLETKLATGTHCICPAGTTPFDKDWETIQAAEYDLPVYRDWGDWAFQRKQWFEAAKACAYGLAGAEQLLARHLLREHKEICPRELGHMSAAKAYALVRPEFYEVEGTTEFSDSNARVVTG
jgi:hypothetical protein